MKILIEKICNLIKIKSIVTLMLTLLFFILSLNGNVPSEVKEIYLIVIAFYFGTQSNKGE